MKNLKSAAFSILIGAALTPCHAQLSQNIVINEFMALNETTISDEFGEYDDWIELYNTTSADINISGYYISDNPADSLKFQLPTNDSLIIPANGHLLLWADGQPLQGSRHLGFRLSALGECIQLTQSNGSTKEDLICFDAQTADVSAGRNGDGVDEWTYFAVGSATPGTSNLTTGLEEVEEEAIQFYPNPTKRNMVFSRPASGSLYDINGRLLEQFNQQSRIQLDYPSGSYILEIDGQKHKFLIR